MMTVMRQALKFIERATALGGLAAAMIAAPAIAQPGPQLQAELTLADGRAAQIFTFGDGLGFRLQLEGADRIAQGEGNEDIAAELLDFDGDGFDDIVVHSNAGYEAFDISTGDLFLLYPACQQPFEDCVSEQTERFTPSAAQEILERWEEAALQAESAQALPLEGEAAMAFSNQLAAVRGAIFAARVREARLAAALAERAGEPEATAQADEGLRAALLAREEFLSAREHLFAD